MCTRSVLLLLVAAAAAWAQAEDKPRTSAPEPQRQRPSTTSMTLVVVQYDVADRNVDGFAMAIPELVKYVAQQERVHLQVQWRAQRLSEPGLEAARLLYMTGCTAQFQITDAEKAALSRYLRSGGLLFADDIRHTDANTGPEGQGAGVGGTPFDRQLKALLKDPQVLGSDGDAWQPVPGSHPLYHAYFDFPDGPPLGGVPGGNVRQLEMLQLRGRPVAIFSDLNLSWYWGDPLASSRERGLQFGTNLLVYAMTQSLGR